MSADRQTLLAVVFTAILVAASAGPAAAMGPGPAPTDEGQVSQDPGATPVPIDGAEPTDPNGDGRYEDLDGDGEWDYGDVVVFSRHLDDPAVTDHPDAYDFDGSGTVGRGDLLWLLNQRYDADGDGIASADERAVGLDPRAADSDGDGTPDAEETVERTVTDAETGASASVSGTPRAVADASVGPADRGGLRAGPAVQVSAGGGVADVRITVPLNDSLGGDALSDVRLYAAGANGQLRPVETTVDAESRTASASLSGSATVLPVVTTRSDGGGDGELVRRSLVDDESGTTATVVLERSPANEGNISLTADPWRAGHQVSLLAPGTIRNATVTVPLSASLSERELSNVTVYGFTPANRTFRTLPATVDADNRTARVAVDESTTVLPIVEAAGNESVDCVGGCVAKNRSDAIPVETPAASAVGGPSFEEIDTTPEPPANPDYVVANDGSGDFRTIQSAVDAAAPFDTVLVREGTYHEQVVLDEPVFLIGQDATLDGATLAGDEHEAITVLLNATIRGFTIRNYETGIDGSEAHGPVTVTDTRIRVTGETEHAKFAKGIAGSGSTGDWTIRRVAVDSDFVAVETARSGGNWTVENSSLRGDWDGVQAGHRNFSFLDTAHPLPSGETGDSLSVRNTTVDGGMYGILASGSERDGSIRGTSVDGDLSAVATYQTVGAWSVSRSRLTADYAAIDARGAAESVTVRHVAAESDLYGVVAGRTAGDWTMADVRIESSLEGIEAPHAAGDWSLSRTTVVSDEVAVEARESTGDWTVSTAALDGEAGGVDAVLAEGDWTVRETAVAGDYGVRARGTDGEWRVSNATVDADEGVVLQVVAASGNWTIAGLLARHGAVGVYGVGTDGTITVSDSRFVAHALDGIVINEPVTLTVHETDFVAQESAILAPPRDDVDATGNWWGQAGGPAAGQVDGGVTTSDACATPCADDPGM